MENAKNKTNKKVTRTFKNIVTAALLSAFTFVANEGIAQNTTNNDNNIRTSQTINRISLSDYHSLLDKRNQIMRDKYKDYDTRELLESTQKEVFLRAYKNNDNLVKTNINDLKKILNEKFKIKTNDAIETLNQSLILIANSGEIEGLKNFTNQISIKTFDINTINAIGLIEANYLNLWEEKRYDTPTWNTTNHGLLKIVVNLLDKIQNTANFNDYVRPTKIAEKPVDTNKTTKDNDKTTNIGEDVINLDEDLNGEVINLDDEETIEPSIPTETVTQKTKEEKNTVIEEKPIKTKKPIDIKKPEIEQEIPKRNNNAINLDEDIIDLGSNEDQQIKDPRIEISIPDSSGLEIEKDNVIQDINYDKNNEARIPDKDTQESISINEFINLNQIDEGGEINTLDFDDNVGYLEDMILINYDFEKELSQDLNYNEQKHKIENLMYTYPIIKEFIDNLTDLKIHFHQGDNTNINRTAAILRAINGNFDFGQDAVKNAKENNQYGAEAVKSIIFQNRTRHIMENNNLKIVDNMGWDVNILANNLSKDKLNNVSYQDIIDMINEFKDDEIKKAFMYHLLNNDIIKAQKIMGMDINCDSRYPDYRAGKKLGKIELNKIKKLGKYRRYVGQKEILQNKYIPQDVKNTYLDFLSGKIKNKGKNYTILSKTDFKIYLFSANHYLLSRHNVLVGSEVGDHINNPMKGIRTTPGGLYEVGNSFEKSSNGEDFFKKYGTHYIVLIPMEGQYAPSNQYTMGLHGTYEVDASRDRKINSLNAKDRRATNGCINVSDDIFGEIFNQMKIGSIFFITKEPSSQDIKNFLTLKK